jgi:hypothetical protein
MHARTTFSLRWLVIGLSLMVGAEAAQAQAWAYPAFQPPRVTTREFNFGIADASGSGTTVLFQWREGTGPRGQLSLDLGLADPEGEDDDLQLLVGGQIGYELARENADLPLDFLFTGGAFAAVGDITFLRLPFGVSIGHRFPLEGGLALTPYVHPRLSIDFCGECRTDNDVGVNFDLGMNFEITQKLAFRVSAMFGGSDLFNDDGFGVSLAWTPPGLATR